MLALLEDMGREDHQFQLTAAPYNAAICAAFRAERPSVAHEIYTSMLHTSKSRPKEVTPNVITFTSLMTNMAKLEKYDFCIEYYKEFSRMQIQGNEAIYGCTVIAAERLSDWRTALGALEAMRTFVVKGANDERVPSSVPSSVYTSAIGACGKAGEVLSLS